MVGRAALLFQVSGRWITEGVLVGGGREAGGDVVNDIAIVIDSPDQWLIFQL